MKKFIKKIAVNCPISLAVTNVVTYEYMIPYLGHENDYFESYNYH